MVGEATQKKLYDAASKGDLLTFQQLVQGDPYLLDGVSFSSSRNLLHVSAIWGQAAIVEEVLRIHPILARSLDSQKSSPLHIVAEQGNLEITKLLVKVAPEMCWWRDCQGMNPVHVAAVNGHVEILQAFIQLDPFPAMEKVDRGQSVLHLCVKHRQLGALEFLVGKLGDNIVQAKDDDGQTLLHLAAGYNNVEMTKFLMENTKIEKLSVDSRGRTALDMVKGGPQDTNDTTYSEMKELLDERPHFSTDARDIFNQMKDVIMVVMVLIATMAFQAAVSPPGGVWQDDSATHRAGEAVMASSRPKIYRNFVRANTTAFVSSLITIFMLSTRMPSINPVILSGVVYSMWVAMASIAVSYGASLTVITPDMEAHSLMHVIKVVVAVSLGLLGFVLVGTLLPVTWLLNSYMKRLPFQDILFRFNIRKVCRLPPRQTLYQYSH